MTPFDDTTAEQLAMEVALLLSSGDPLKYREAHENQLNLQGFVGFERAKELIDQATETLSMVIPTTQIKWHTGLAIKK